MKDADTASLQRMALERDPRMSDVVEREQLRLRRFIRRRVADPRDAEDILQERGAASGRLNRVWRRPDCPSCQYR